MPTHHTLSRHTGAEFYKAKVEEWDSDSDSAESEDEADLAV